ncbi:6-phosphogluconolactonase [Actinomycetospora sp. OC33-EN08]|uniref:6-phosphogluconolactonase n=1 Tax=Actinomycetospora aurantiaca TaxID=3129233 RepID=A0ABU8MUJ1_9PSEU
MSRDIITLPDDGSVAADGAARLLAALAKAQADRGVASVVLTGGGIGIAMLEAVATSSELGSVDWSRVEVFWGDERFVPAGSEDRNDAQARDALLDRLDLDPARVHPMASSTPGPSALESEDSADPDQGAQAYAQVLTEAAARLGEGLPGIPAFDVLLAGCGPEGHTLSVFPDSPAVHATAPGVVAVRDCPKPPPTRISLTLAAARSAREVWLVATGSSKAEVLGQAAGGASEVDVPLAGLAGTERTLWLLDEAAAAQL